VAQPKRQRLVNGLIYEESVSTTSIKDEAVVELLPSIGEEVFGVDDYQSAVIYSLPNLLQWGFPYRQMHKNGEVVGRWVRSFKDPKTGHMYSFTLATSTDDDAGLPFGAFDRVVFSYLFGRAVSQHNPRVCFNSLHDFLATFGFDKDKKEGKSRKSGFYYPRFAESWRRLGSLVMTVHCRGVLTDADGKQKMTTAARSIKVFSEWCEQRTKEEAEADGAYVYDITFDQEFFDRASRVPLNVEAQKMFRGNPKGWDLIWLAQYGTFIATKRQTPYRVSCNQFLAQAATCDSNLSRARASFVRLAKEFCAEFPNYQIEFVGKDVIFYPAQSMDVLLTQPKVAAKRPESVYQADAVPLAFYETLEEQEDPLWARSEHNQAAKAKREAKEQKSKSSNLPKWVVEACSDPDARVKRELLKQATDVWRGTIDFCSFMPFEGRDARVQAMTLEGIKKCRDGVRQAILAKDLEDARMRLQKKNERKEQRALERAAKKVADAQAKAEQLKAAIEAKRAADLQRLTDEGL